MEKRRYPRSVAKFIRREKARIRREVSDPKEQARRILELLQSIKPREES